MLHWRKLGHNIQGHPAGSSRIGTAGTDNETPQEWSGVGNGWVSHTLSWLVSGP